MRPFNVAVSGSRNAWSMTLTPRAALPVVRVDFAGADRHIQRIEVVELGGDRTVTTIRDEGR